MTLVRWLLGSVSLLAVSITAHAELVIETLPDMLQARVRHAATPLGDGRVLVSGGSPFGSFGQLASCEVLDLPTGTWRATGSLNLARQGHGQVLLPDGRVLAVGGWRRGISVATATAEVWDPATGRWELTRDMRVARGAEPTLLPLEDGRVLILGGELDASATATNLIEVFDPETNAFSDWGRLDLARRGFGTCRLSSTELLVVGGTYRCCDHPRNEEYQRSAEILDLGTAASRGASRLPAWPGNAPTAGARLPDGSCLFAGRPDALLVHEGGAWTEHLLPLEGASEGLVIPESAGRVLLIRSVVKRVHLANSDVETLGRVPRDGKGPLVATEDGDVLLLGGYLDGDEPNRATASCALLRPGR